MTLVWQLQNSVEVFASLYLWSEPVSTIKADGSLKKVKLLDKFIIEISEHPSVKREVKRSRVVFYKEGLLTLFL